MKLLSLHLLHHKFHCKYTSFNVLAAVVIIKNSQLHFFRRKDALCRRCQVNKAQALLRKTDPYCWYCIFLFIILLYTICL